MEQTVAWMRMSALVRRTAQRKERKLMTEKEAKKEAFRKYLEFSGVIDSLTKGDIDNMGAEINVTLISEARGSSTILWCESGPFEDIQNRIHDAMEEFVITANNDLDDLIQERKCQLGLFRWLLYLCLWKDMFLSWNRGCALMTGPRDRPQRWVWRIARRMLTEMVAMT
ncbi:hypothetical protein HID58_087504 [Brassica napus]|uniref:Uncharacterized protein n=1 Tax=Brassica napus TaxID=3708 RepID=A0ABQ7XW19_BRANA|nr:hypothetical protein HID58_090050 [Brassica napus]KAH0854137.1 hypothetical protein HID58_090054 [Brassica napus]KAH0859243.1 hypothetical protein HID58_087504 [Brassica napus]